MPVVTINTWTMDKEQKAKFIRKVTNVFVEMGIPAEAVTVMINDLPKDNWGSGGEQHSLRFKDVK